MEVLAIVSFTVIFLTGIIWASRRPAGEHH